MGEKGPNLISSMISNSPTSRHTKRYATLESNELGTLLTLKAIICVICQFANMFLYSKPSNLVK
jgi:hypothetical protein